MTNLLLFVIVAEGVNMAAGSVAFGALMRVRPFSVLFVAEAQSLIGDQLARVALAVLVWTRTGSAAATAVTYALTFLPAILGGFLLARIGDVLPRLDVVVGCDVVRAALFTAMVLPGVPLLVLELLLVLAVFLEPVFSAAQSSYLASTLSDEQYRAATGYRMATHQLGQIGGFALGGALIVLLEPRGALAINAITFLVSAVVIDIGLRREQRAVGRRQVPASLPLGRPRPQVLLAEPAKPASWRVRAHPQVVQLIALSSLAGLFVIPEGLAFPYANAVGLSPTVTGVLLAAIPAGGALGALFLLRVVAPERRRVVALAMAMVCGVPLIATAWNPWWPVVGAAWFVSGLAAAYQVEVFAELARITPDGYRARTMGIAGGFLTGAQGIGLALFGLLAQRVEIGMVVALAGIVGFVLAIAIAAYRTDGAAVTAEVN